MYILFCRCDGLWDVMSNEEVCGFIRIKFDAYQILNEEHCVEEKYLVPVGDTWLYVDVENWTNAHLTSWFDAIEHRFRNTFLSSFNSGKELCHFATAKCKEDLKDTKYANKFDVADSAESRNLILKEIQRDRRIKQPVKETNTKLRLITEQLIDHAVFTKKSEDNVSVTIVLLRSEDTLALLPSVHSFPGTSNSFTREFNHMHHTYRAYYSKILTQNRKHAMRFQKNKQKILLASKDCSSSQNSNLQFKNKVVVKHRMQKKKVIMLLRDMLRTGRHIL